MTTPKKRLPKRTASTAGDENTTATAADTEAMAAMTSQETREERIQREVREKLEADSDFVPILGMSGMLQALDASLFAEDYTVGGMFNVRWVNKSDEANYGRKRRLSGYRLPSEVHPDLEDVHNGPLTLMLTRVESTAKRKAELRQKALQMDRFPVAEVAKDPNLTPL